MGQSLGVKVLMGLTDSFEDVSGDIMCRIYTCVYIYNIYICIGLSFVLFKKV